MKRLLVCLLLVGVVGCGKSQRTANLTACPDCGKEVSKRATACPHCGAPLSYTLVLPPTVGKTTVNSIGMKLTLIPAGEFQMGSPDAEPDRDDDETRHLVKISKPFYLGVYEVTQQQYEKVMGTRPWQGKKYVKEGADYLAVYVSHDDAVEFCRRLSKQEGVEYRLPTEAEWEYACRAGTTTAYSFGDDEAKSGQYAWYSTNAWDIGEKYAHRVGQKLPNPWGLYDMYGNVWEWCHDWYGPYGSEKVVSDPMGPAQGSARDAHSDQLEMGELIDALSAEDAYEAWKILRAQGLGKPNKPDFSSSYPPLAGGGTRVLRGGYFDSHPSYARSANRFNGQPDYRRPHFGFRAARTYHLSP